MSQWLHSGWFWLGLWVLALSVIAFAAMGIDKRRARLDRWRIREATFFILALIGGSPGAVLGMRVFHHKTRHWYFKFGLPAILIVQIALVIWLVLKFQ